MLRVSGLVVVRCSDKSSDASRNGLFDLRCCRFWVGAGLRGLGKEPVGDRPAGEAAAFLKGLLDDRFNPGDGCRSGER